jgi:glutamate-5-semialdehyde dehydrogenase
VVGAMTTTITASARAALALMPPVGDPVYQSYCRELGARLRDAWPRIVKANTEDVAVAGRRGLPDTVVDRLVMGESQFDYLTRLIESVHEELPEASAPGPQIPIAGWGVRTRIPKPLGLVFMVYEARPTVTIEGALLPVAVGNAVLLRAGKEIATTNVELQTVVRSALEAVGLPTDLVTVLNDPTRRVMRALLADPRSVDVLIPRGSPSLIDYCRTATSIPVIASGGGVNHLYVDADADLELAAAITLDSKLSEPTACNSLELVLVHAEVAAGFVAALNAAVAKDGRDCTIRLDPRISAGPDLKTLPLDEHDLGREFLAPSVGVLEVSGIDEAIAHIRRYGSAHTEAVVSADDSVVNRFVASVDAATIVVNGSLRLHDGPTMGLGCELSIATGRLHVRGSVGLRSLLTYSWVVQAHGALRDQLHRIEGIKTNDQ